LRAKIKDDLVRVLGEISSIEIDATENGLPSLAETCRRAGDHVIEAIREFEKLSRDIDAAIAAHDESPENYRTNGVFTP
jgi:hypothetical protein